MRHLLTLFLLLSVLSCCTTPSRRDAMRRGLDSINVLNRTDQPFTVADVQPYVRFFDRHGQANDRLLAHYLLGRAYYDHGEAPMALQCYQDAIGCADTTAADCDFVQLSRVYSQMSEVFYNQILYRQELLYAKMAEHYAWKGCDTLAALMNYEQQGLVYCQLGNIDSAIYVMEDASKGYSRYHYDANAAIVLGVIVPDIISRGDYAKAKRYMDKYESESGLFDDSGDIEKGREYYYRIKGTYFLSIGRLDSAEYWFRKELRDGKDYNNQNGGAMGLATLYEQCHMPDSAAKYYKYAYAMNDSMYAQMATETVERMQAVYDYSRHQEKARQEEKKAADRAVVIWICIGALFLLLFIVYVVVSKLHEKSEAIRRNYEQSLVLIAQGRHDLARLRAKEEFNRELIAEKERAIREQETILKALLKSDSRSHSHAERTLKSSEVYGRFEQLSIVGEKPVDAEWHQMQAEVFRCYPGFGDFLCENTFRLHDKEQKTCLLIRAGFNPTVISHMIGVNPSYISNIRSAMLEKLFKLQGSSKVFDKMIRDIY